MRWGQTKIIPMRSAQETPSNTNSSRAQHSSSRCECIACVGWACYSLDPPLRELAGEGYSHLLAPKRRIGGHLHRGKGVTAHLLARLAAQGYLHLLTSGCLNGESRLYAIFTLPERGLARKMGGKWSSNRRTFGLTVRVTAI